MGGASTRCVISVPTVALSSNVLQIDPVNKGQIDKQGTGTLTLTNSTDSLTAVSEAYTLTVTQTASTAGSFHAELPQRLRDGECAGQGLTNSIVTSAFDSLLSQFTGQATGNVTVTGAASPLR